VALKPRVEPVKRRFKLALKRCCWRVVNLLPDAWAIRSFHLWYFKRLPNLSKPKTLNEKIAWRKLYQRDGRFKIFADKVAAKTEIARLIGEDRINKTLWTGVDPAEIPFDRLIPPFVIKTNHGSGGNIFVRTSADINLSAIKESLTRQLAYSHAHRWREWGYCNIPRKILVEEMIVDENGQMPDDYRFYVYHGRALYIQVDYDRFTDHRRQVFDRSWQRLPMEYKYPGSDVVIPVPAMLAELIDVAEKIGEEFDFARVDLYATFNGVKFGEVTFYPAAGLGDFRPVDWDARFGEPWQLPTEFVAA
jgi:TupA-like ATPgrasp